MAKRINYYLPYMRQGITTLAEHEAVPGKRMNIPVKLSIAALNKEDGTSITDVVEKEITLYGPGDLLGINENVISRLAPAPNTNNFESALTPFIEFSEPDFLWRFSSLQTPDKNNWIPWLALIILKAENGEEEGEFVKVQGSNKELPAQIQLKQNAILPDLRESWRWSHVHKLDIELDIAGSTAKQKQHRTQILNSIKSTPEKAVCRLLSPRKLKPQTKYHAFLIPAFKIGAEAAMGVTQGVEDRTLLNWEAPSDGAGKTLPYYYDWEFGTGSAGDFEQLVRKLKPRDLVKMGFRPIDCSNPGYGMQEEAGLELHMEAALKSLDTKYQSWGMDSSDADDILNKEKRQALSNLLNKREEEIDGKVKLRVTPPVYGEWYASRQGEALDPKSKSLWLEELNLDFRHRAAAGLGVQFVKENQENLMKAAWEQLSKIKKVNQELNVGRFGREISNTMYRRLDKMDPTNVFNIALPVKNKIAFQSGKTIGAALKTSTFSNNLTRIKMRKYVSKIKLTQRQVKFKPVKATQLVSSGFGVHGMTNVLKRSTITSRSVAPAPTATISWPTGVVAKTISALDPKTTIERRIEKRISRFSKIEKTKTAPGPTEDKLHSVKWHPEFHRPMYRFLRGLSQEYILPGLENVPQNTVGLLQTNRRFIEAFMMGLNHEMASELRWREFRTDMLGSYFRSFWDTSIYSLDTKEKKQFRKTEIGSKLLEQIHKKYGDAFNTFPKIEKTYTTGEPSEIEQEIADAYEAAVEKWLLTREEDKDIEALASWKNDNRLGDHPIKNGLSNKEEDKNRMVLLIRGELLQKFSNTLVYLVEKIGNKPDLKEGAVRTFPIFEGALPPDIVFLGFDFPATDAHKFFVVFEERMTELRFGLDETPEGQAPGPGENDFSWQHFPTLSEEGYLDGIQPTILKQKWNNAAYIGKVMTQKQVRAAVELETLLPDKL